jgi:hypothetical protein
MAIGIITWTCTSLAACIYTAYCWGVGRWLFIGTITQTVKQLKCFISSARPDTSPLSSPSFHSPELPIKLEHIHQAPASSAKGVARFAGISPVSYVTKEMVGD